MRVRAEDNYARGSLGRLLGSLSFVGTILQSLSTPAVVGQGSCQPAGIMTHREGKNSAGLSKSSDLLQVLLVLVCVKDEI